MISTARKRRANFVFALAERIWRWECARGIPVPYTTQIQGAAALCLYATKDCSDKNSNWHSAAFDFYTSGSFVNYRSEIPDEEAILLITQSGE